MNLMNLMTFPFKGIIKNKIKNYISNEEDKIIDMIAKKVSIPNISAAKERDIIKKIYDTLQEVADEVLNTI